MAEETEELTPPPEPETDSDSEAPAKKTTTPRQEATGLMLVEAVAKLTSAIILPDPDERLYNAIMDDRPIKFTAKQVQYKPDAGDDTMRCGNCWHMAIFPAPARKKLQHGACEIMRSEDTESVEPAGRCTWWTEDGVMFPLRESQSKAPTEVSGAAKAKVGNQSPE